MCTLYVPTTLNSLLWASIALDRRRCPICLVSTRVIGTSKLYRVYPVAVVLVQLESRFKYLPVGYGLHNMALLLLLVRK